MDPWTDERTRLKNGKRIQGWMDKGRREGMKEDREEACTYDCMDG
jgi:hypothetical protein